LKYSQSSRRLLRRLVLIALLGGLGLSAAIAQGIIIPIGPGVARLQALNLRPIVPGVSQLPPGP
jgi:hypothetical protein